MTLPKEQRTESENKHRTLLNCLQAPVIALRKDLTIYYCNRAFEKMVGKSKTEMQDKNIADILPDSSKIQLIDTFQKVIANSIADKIESVLNNNPVLIQVYPTPFGMITIIEDISDLKAIESALRQEKDIWELTFDSVPDLISIIDEKFNIIKVNRAMAVKLKASSTECINQKCFDLLHQCTYPDENCPHIMTIKDKKEHVVEINDKMFKGDYIVSTNPAFTRDGKFLGSVHVARDITTRKEMERKLLESEIRYRKLVENSPVAILVHTKNKIVYVNDAGIKMIEAESAEEILSRSIFDFVHPDFRKTSIQRIKKALSTGNLAEKVEEKIITKLGNVLSVEVIGVPIHYQGSLAIQLVIWDITLRKQLITKLEEYNHILQSVIDAPEDVEIYALDCKLKFIAYNQKAKQACLERWNIDIHTDQNIIDLLGKSNQDIQSDATVKMFNRVLKGEKIKFENQLVTNGKKIWQYQRINPILGNNNIVEGIVVYITDITLRKEVELKREKIILNLKELLTPQKTDIAHPTMCANCFKMKNENNDYIPVADYLLDTYGILVSHGLCLECLKEFYPFDYEKLIGEIQKPKG
jgi:PAS domain S-box-containing protein